MEFYYKKLKCIDETHIEVQGDYNSYKAREFVILFTKCDNSTYTGPGFCKPEHEIIEWLRRKFIFVVMNTQRFSTSEFSDEKKKVDESRTLWIPVST